ncbi:MAG: MFS transporter [Syntrophomonadaceae bacterium]|nr:MFS transporter [Syntrophomonadaceae bacterium]
MIMDRKNLLTPVFFLAGASLFMGLYSGLYDPSFNNYLSQVHQLGEVARGGLEFPRELPGFLVVFLFTALLFLRDSRIAFVAALMVGISLWGQGFLSPDMRAVVFWMLLWSAGAHLSMLLRSSLGLRLAEKGGEGRLLGRMGAYESTGALLGMLVVFYGVSRFNISFGTIFAISGTCALIAAVAFLMIRPKPVKRPPRYLVFKKKYSLYYLLSILFGARKQVFLTFAPWVLIKIFQSDVRVFAILGLIGTVLSLVIRPLIGRAIDNFGERSVIMAESLILVIICALYALGRHWFVPAIAVYVIMACYIIDQLLMAVTIARATYLNRIADSIDDIAPTLSMGLTLDHAVSMTVPIGGGLLWAAYGYEWVFLAAAIIALVNLVAAFFISQREDLELTAD